MATAPPKFKPGKAVGNSYKLYVIRLKAYYFWHACIACGAAGFIAGMVVAR